MMIILDNSTQAPQSSTTLLNARSARFGQSYHLMYCPPDHLVTCSPAVQTRGTRREWSGQSGHPGARDTAGFDIVIAVGSSGSSSPPQSTPPTPCAQLWWSWCSLLFKDTIYYSLSLYNFTSALLMRYKLYIHICISLPVYF